jgi:hypothetical protein
MCPWRSSRSPPGPGSPPPDEADPVGVQGLHHRSPAGPVGEVARRRELGDRRPQRPGPGRVYDEQATPASRARIGRNRVTGAPVHPEGRRKLRRTAPAGSRRERRAVPASWASRNFLQGENCRWRDHLSGLPPGGSGRDSRVIRGTRARVSAGGAVHADPAIAVTLLHRRHGPPPPQSAGPSCTGRTGSVEQPWGAATGICSRRTEDRRTSRRGSIHGPPGHSRHPPDDRARPPGAGRWRGSRQARARVCQARPGSPHSLQVGGDSSRHRGSVPSSQRVSRSGAVGGAGGPVFALGGLAEVGSRRGTHADRLAGPPPDRSPSQWPQLRMGQVWPRQSDPAVQVPNRGTPQAGAVLAGPPLHRSLACRREGRRSPGQAEGPRPAGNSGSTRPVPSDRSRSLPVLPVRSDS